MKILLISPYFSPAVGGVETHLNDLCTYLSSQNHKVYVRTYKALSTKLRGSTNETVNNTYIHRMWWPDFNLNYHLDKFPPLRFIYVFLGLFFDCLFFLLKNRDVEVIQSHGFIAAVIGTVLGKLFNIRNVINTHVGFKFSSGSSLMNLIICNTLKNSDQILVLVPSAKKELESIGVPSEKISQYHYWVDQRKFIPSKSFSKEFSILFIGRLVPQKGLDTLVSLAKKMPSVKFTVIGSGPLSDYLKNQSNVLSNLNFLGRVENNQLTKYYHQSTLLLVPSKNIDQTYEEGIPRVIIEALSCGLPVVATKTGGTVDVIKTSAAILVKDDIGELMKVIRDLKNNPSKISTMSKSARTFAQNTFGIFNAKIIESSLHGK